MQPLSNRIVVEARIHAPVDQVWKRWTTPEHIEQWNAASDEWHCPSAFNDLKVGGTFSYRMEAKDGVMGFDFAGTYIEVQPQTLIAYRLGEGPGAREVRIAFEATSDETVVRETFEADAAQPIEMQRGGWQAILDRFKAQTEAARD